MCENPILILSFNNYLQLIFISSISIWQGGIASRRRNSKMTYNFEVLNLKSMVMEPYVSKSKVWLGSMDLRVLGHFGKLVSRATTFMFWVFSKSKWNYVKKCHEVWKKYKILTLENFSVLKILTFCWLFQILWFF